jgi:RNA polymerase sigma-54 factor
MVLTPQLRQRIEMLQMTSMELNELIEQEMVSNPILEEVMPGDEVQEISENILDQNADGFANGLDNGAAEVVEGTLPNLDSGEPFQVGEVSLNGSSSDADSDDETPRENADAFDEIDFGREFQDYLDPGYRTQEIEYKEDAPSFEQFLSHTPSLSEHLEWQLHLLDVPEEVSEAAVLVIGNLDDDGRLSVSIEEIAEMTGCSIETAEKARQAIMQLDPVGCGAMDVKDCLLAQ